ncbi:RNA polymerase II associated protein 3-like protein, partial [Leptotrombidium deliense]
MSDSAVCEALREKENGNGFFKNGKFEESIVCYSRAITLCDATEEAQLSVLYSNRAFAKLKLKRYLTSIDDATQSFLLNNEYSKPLFHRYKARLALGHLQEALYDINGVCILEGEKVNIKEHERARDELLLDLSAIKIPEFVQNLPKLKANDRIIKDVFKDFRNHALFDE